MSGTKAGGKLAAAKNKALYGNDFYRKIGAKGGKVGSTGGFAVKVPCTCDVFPWEHIKAECAGAVGGAKSRRRYGK